MEFESWESFARSSSSDDFWVWFTVLLVLGLACGFGIFYYVRRARIIQNTPTSKIRSAPQGYVELIGQLKYLTQQPTIAPLTGKTCAWYRYCVEEERITHTKNGTRSSWHTIEQEVSEQVFQCEDETGHCMIDPRKAEIHPSSEDIWYGHSRWPSSGPSGGGGLMRTGGYRYTEKRLAENDPLYILGSFRTIDPNKAHGSITEETRVILKVWKNDQATLLEKFDTDRNGEIDLQEWDIARNTAEQQAYQQRLARADKAAVNIMTKTDDFRRPYIISTKPQSNMVRGFKLKAFACTVGFVLFSPFSIWMLIVRLSG